MRSRPHVISGSASRACGTQRTRDALESGRKAGVTTDEHKEVVELRRRNRVLEMENEILKRVGVLC
ncbi:transposase-like protein [Microbacterium sp. SORGH_AS 344]|nr:transposase-like protein [Microbacterium sp. SORGH_AS_0344]